MRKILKTKMAWEGGIFLTVVFITGILLFYFVKRTPQQLTAIQNSLRILNEELQPVSGKMKDFSDSLLESKKWALEALREEDVATFDQLRSGYQKRHQKALDLFKSIEAPSDPEIEKILQGVNMHLQTFSQRVNDAFEEQNLRFSVKEEKVRKMDQFFDLARQINRNLTPLETQYRSNPDIQNRLKNLKKLLMNSQDFFSGPLFSVVSPQPQDRMERVIDKIRKNFKDGMSTFDKRIQALFPLLKTEEKQYLHKARTLSIDFGQLVLSEGSLSELYEDEIPRLLAIWKAAEDLNVTMDTLQKEEKNMTLVGKKLLNKVNASLKSSQKENKARILLTMLLVALFGTGAGRFILKKKNSGKKTNASKESIQSEFPKTLSHEFRTQLSSIISLSELILSDQKQILDGRGKKNVTQVIQSGRDLLALINSMEEKGDAYEKKDPDCRRLADTS